MILFEGYILLISISYPYISDADISLIIKNSVNTLSNETFQETTTGATNKTKRNNGRVEHGNNTVSQLHKATGEKAKKKGVSNTLPLRILRTAELERIYNAAVRGLQGVEKYDIIHTRPGSNHNPNK